ncbi:MAG: helix-turn-helix domain-containing protein [Spirochaetia bacterium]|nr:helix-turn-helix domain-containing protein [Spirochaetia bacterium]
MKYFVLLLTLIISPVLAQPILLTEDNGYSLESRMDIVAVSKDVTIAEVQKENFFRNSLSVFPKPVNENNYWIRFQVKNTAYSGNWYLFLNHLNLDYVEFYSPDHNGHYVKQIAGDHIPFSDWSRQYSHPLFRFFLNEGEAKTIYLHINTTSNVDFAPAIYAPGALAKREVGVTILKTVNFLVNAVFFGIFLFYFRKNNNRHFLYLIPILLSYYLYIFFSFGNYYRFWPEFPWLQNRIFFFIILIGLYQLIYASIKFLKIKENSLNLWYLFILLMLSGLPGFYLFHNMEYFFRSWMVIHAALSLLLVLISSTIIYARGNDYVKYYLYFQIVIQGGVYIKILNFFEILDPNEWRYNWPAIFFPAGILVLIKFVFEEYRKISREKEDLDYKYNELVKKLSRSGKKSRTMSLDRSSILFRISEMIEDNSIFTEEIFTLNKMAALLKIRPDQLSELINREMKMNFNTFINTIRIHRACELIEMYTSKNMTEIFYESGFRSKAPFNSAFREIMDMSPSEFREKQNRSLKRADGPHLLQKIFKMH